MAQAWKRQVDRFCSQYLQLEQTLDVPEDRYLKLSEVQNAIAIQLFRDGSFPYSGPPLSYQLRKLKELVSRIEASIDDWDVYEVSDDLMSYLALLLSLPLPSETNAMQQKCRVVYHIAALPSDDAHITLLENRSLISASGTTGLRTWEAALHLGEFLCRHSSVISKKSILELGAGTGYLCILCAKHLQSKHVIASDGSDEVVNHLPENFFLNELQGSSCINAMDLKWGSGLQGTDEECWNGGRGVDVVLGADITYDSNVIPALVATILEIFALYPQVEVIIAATQRNLQTFQVFLDQCQQNKLSVADLPFEVPPRDRQDGPFYDDKAAIRICRVYK